MARVRTRVSLCVVAVAFACFAAMAGVAFGAPGDSAHPILLNTYVGQTYTGNLVPDTGIPDAATYYFRVDLEPGQTLRADFKTSADDVLGLNAIVTSDNIQSKLLPDGTARLTFTSMRSTTSNYEVRVYASHTDSDTPGTFSVEPVILNPVWRFRNLKNGFYLWTASEAEKTNIVNTLYKTWKLEGLAYSINPATNTKPLYRFRNLAGGFYLYTADESEKTSIVNTLAKIWTLEGPAYNVSTSSSGGAQPVWRFRNKKNGTYLYSADPAEKANIINTLSATWLYEGPAFYIAP